MAVAVAAATSDDDSSSASRVGSIHAEQQRRPSQAEVSALFALPSQEANDYFLEEVMQAFPSRFGAVMRGEASSADLTVLRQLRERSVRRASLSSAASSVASQPLAAHIPSSRIVSAATEREQRRTRRTVAEGAEGVPAAATGEVASKNVGFSGSATRSSSNLENVDLQTSSSSSSSSSSRLSSLRMSRLTRGSTGSGTAVSGASTGSGVSRQDL